MNSDGGTLTMLINGTSGYADYVTDKSFLQQFYLFTVRGMPHQWLDHSEPILCGLLRDDGVSALRKLAIAACVTLREKASMDGNL